MWWWCATALREVKRAMKYNGKPCAKTSQAVACNPQSCEKDRELTAWTKWSWCSKDCDGGTRKRQRFVKMPAEGAGKRATTWSKDRLQFKACNMKRCMVPVADPVTKCNETLDIVFLIDGSGSLGQSGWDAEIKAAKMFVDSCCSSACWRLCEKGCNP